MCKSQRYIPKQSVIKLYYKKIRRVGQNLYKQCIYIILAGTPSPVWLYTAHIYGSGEL